MEIGKMLPKHKTEKSFGQPCNTYQNVDALGLGNLCYNNKSKATTAE